MRRAVPHAITFLGHALTLSWILGAPIWLGLLGLLCDAFDGFAARRLGASSAYGALYDWTVDVTVCALLVARLGATPLLALIVPVQVLGHLRGWHFSGRTLATLAAMASS